MCTASPPSSARRAAALACAALLPLMLAAGAARAQDATPRTTTYAGTLPCADCAGIATELTLAPARDGQPPRYRLREAYLTHRPGEHEFNMAGRWRATRGLPGNPQAQVVVLDAGEGAPPGGRRFVRLAPGVLDALDGDGWRLPLPARLFRDTGAAAQRAAAPLQRYAGTLRRAADGGWLLEPCGSTRALPATDGSPGAALGAALAELGFGRLPAIHLDAFGRQAADGLLLLRLNRAGAELRCEPPAAGAQFTAQGNEPFWQLQGDEDALALRTPASETRWPAAALRWQWRGHRADEASAQLAASSRAGAIRIELTPGVCRDTMADAAYGFRAQAQLAQGARSRTLRGCAYLGGEPPP